MVKAAEVTGMKAETLTQVTDELSDFSKAELDAWAAGFDEGKASSNTMFEMAGQNPKTGHGLQDIQIREDPGAGRSTTTSITT